MTAPSAVAAPPHCLPANEAARLIAAGSLGALELAEACLARIAQRDGELRAWAFVEPEQVRAEAASRDRTRHRGPLAGIPIGVKDIIDTADMPTEMGSPIYRGHRPPADAACVGLLRMAGAVIMGKTVTTEFAGSHPGPTTNPHDPTRTPGGSSSGSAAAVADGMVPVALGTQTGGSVLRPSAYCGIIGFKPTFGTFNLGGVKPAAESLDTLGLHARSLEDIELVAACLAGRPARALKAGPDAPRIGVCRTPMWDAAAPETMAALEDAAARLGAAGAHVSEVVLAPEFAAIDAARELINAYERSRLMAHEWTHHRDLLSERLRAILTQGYDMPYDDYIGAMELAGRCRHRIGESFAGLDVILAPAADGEAPPGLGATGNARFQGIWTFLHLPTITLPTHLSPAGMPVGIQLVGRHRGERLLLDAAKWAFDTLGPATARMQAA